jgi:type IV secretory pathway VirB10-like protein
MSDYIPNPPDPRRDPRNSDAYYEPSGSKGLTLVVGILVAIALVAGLMFFAGNRHDRNDQAQLPVQDHPVTAPSTSDQLRLPAIPPRPAQPAAPAATPAPATPQQ